MLPLGTRAPDFQLPDTSGKTVSLADFKKASALAVVFMCNHCPYVKHIRSGLAQLARDYVPRGVAVVGISSNDVANYPADSQKKWQTKRRPQATFSRIFTTRRRKPPRLTRPPARQTSISSMGTNGLCIAVNSTTAARAMGCRSPARICALPWMPFSQARKCRQIRRRAWVAISNGRLVTNLITFERRPWLGIEIGGTKLQLVLGDKSARIVERRRFEVTKEKGAAGIREQIAAALPDFLAGKRVRAIGVGFGGPVDWRTGRIARSHHIEGWSGFDLVGWLHKLINLPVFVDNDANVASLGESRRGAGVGYNPVFYVTLGSGVGGGLVADGRIYHGATPGEAEIGHVRLDRSGTILESRCSGWSVDARLRELKRHQPDSPIARLIGDSIGGEAKHLSPALEQNDPIATQVLNEVAEDMAFGLSHVVHLFHPQIVILGGGLSQIGEPLRSRVERSLRRFIMEAFAPGPVVALAALGEDAVPVGALVLAQTKRSTIGIAGAE